jgi:membrane protein
VAAAARLRLRARASRTHDRGLTRAGAGYVTRHGVSGCRAQGALPRLRERSPRVDHVIRAYGHYTQARGNQLAGAVTYFGFLSFFPLLAVSFSVLGWVVVVYPDARAEVEQVLAENLPGLVGSGSGKIDIETIANAKAGVGLLGLAGLLYAGLGWLDALREAMRQVYGLDPAETNVVVRKLKDIVLLALLGTGALLTVATSSLATSATRQVLGLVDLDGLDGRSRRAQGAGARARGGRRRAPAHHHLRPAAGPSTPVAGGVLRRGAGCGPARHP